MAIPNGMGLVPYRTLLDVANNIPWRVEWRGRGDWMGMGMERMKAPNWGTSSGRPRDRNSDCGSHSLWLLTRVPL
jgi:hypothetical protein